MKVRAGEFETPPQQIQPHIQRNGKREKNRIIERGQGIERKKQGRQKRIVKCRHAHESREIHERQRHEHCHQQLDMAQFTHLVGAKSKNDACQKCARIKREARFTRIVSARRSYTGSRKPVQRVQIHGESR